MLDLRRRQFLTLLGSAVAAWPLAGAADARPRLACLALGPPQNAHLAFLDGLRRLGYAQGRNVDIDHRYGDVEKLKPLAQELIALKPDILVADSPSGAITFKSVAPTLPIVCLALTDAGIPDLFASYARPGGNVTGMAQSVEGVTGKLVEVALEIIPGARRIGFLSNPRGASMQLFAESVDVAARARGIAVLTEEVATGGELASAFARFGGQGVQAVIVPVNGLFFSEAMQIAQLALAARLPTVGAERRYIEGGLLASYGIDQRESYRRGASYVDRILKGAKPGDLPIEFPTRIELTINLKTAQALGLDLPPSLVTRADACLRRTLSTAFVQPAIFAAAALSLSSICLLRSFSTAFSHGLLGVQRAPFRLQRRAIRFNNNARTFSGKLEMGWMALHSNSKRDKEAHGGCAQ